MLSADFSSLILGATENYNEEKIHEKEDSSRERAFSSITSPDTARLDVTPAAHRASGGLYHRGEESRDVLGQSAGP